MAQFDVYRTPGGRNSAIPYVVSLQWTRLDHLATRLVAPLALRNAAPAIENHHLTPCFELQGQQLWLDIFNLATVPVVRLDHKVGSLADEDSRSKIIRALDELVSQA
jgi:toxin CcdB